MLKKNNKIKKYKKKKQEHQPGARTKEAVRKQTLVIRVEFRVGFYSGFCVRRKTLKATKAVAYKRLKKMENYKTLSTKSGRGRF